MTTAVQHRRGTTAEHSTFTGLEGELTIDTTKDTAVIHDGSLAGGYPLAKETLANVNPSTLSAITGAATASDDLFLMYDTSALAMKKISRAELNNAITIEALDTVDINGGTIDGVSIGSSTASSGAFTSLTSSSTTTLNGTTIPASKTLVTTDNTQTLSNKTLTSPIVNTATILGGTINNTVIGGTTPVAGSFTTLTASTSITEASKPIASQADIGTAPNEIPLNGYLGGLAYQDTVMVPVPASTTAIGNVGQIAQDGAYLYVCTAQDTWKRVAISTW